MDPIKVLIWDPCPFGSPTPLTVAHMRVLCREYVLASRECVLASGYHERQGLYVEDYLPIPRIDMGVRHDTYGPINGRTVEARRLEYDCPPTPKPRGEGHSA